MTALGWSDILRNIVLPLAVPFFLYLAWDGVNALKQKGYHTVYAEALLRAVGAAANAAQANGTTLLTPTGRAIGVDAGVKYLEATVPDASIALNINTAGHAQRVAAQIGAVALTPATIAPSPGPVA